MFFRPAMYSSLNGFAHRFYERKLFTPDSGRATIINKRQLAYLSPRLGVLNNIPFAIPFDVRVEIFRKFVQNDIQSRGYTPWAGRMGTAKVVVRREHIAQDGFDKLGEVDLRAPIAITFIDQWGNEECVLEFRHLQPFADRICGLVELVSTAEACSRSS